MKKLNITEQELDSLILKTVKKHLTEQSGGNLALLKKYLDTAAMKIEKIKRLLQHPDASFLIEDHEEVIDEGVATALHADELLKILEAEFGSFTPDIEKGYSKKEFSEPVKPKKKTFSMNENSLGDMTASFSDFENIIKSIIIDNIRADKVLKRFQFDYGVDVTGIITRKRSRRILYWINHIGNLNINKGEGLYISNDEINKIINIAFPKTKIDKNLAE